MTRHLSSQLRLSFIAALVVAGCATKQAPPMVAAAPPPAAPRVNRVVPAANRPAPLTGIVAGTLRDFEENVGDQVFFTFDQSDLDDAARDVLQKQAAWLQRYPQVTMVVQGNCDERGTREYNIALGARRATAAKDYLVSLGVNATRLSTISYGKEKPVCVESDEACWAKNRRDVSAIANEVQAPNIAMR